MRIVSGKAKGRRLSSPRGKAVRPTADRIKESVFNILGNQWAGIRGLDLFSGTGSLGLEAISRGARQMVFVEESKSALRTIRKNISLCGFDAHATVMAMSVPKALALLGREKQAFDIIFADPPYGQGWVEKTLRHIAAHRVLCQKGLIVMEHAPYESPLPQVGSLITVQRRNYGDTSISFLAFEALDNPERADYSMGDV